MQLVVKTIRDFIVEFGDKNEDSVYDQFTLIEIFGVYLVVHNYDVDSGMKQEFIAYDDLIEAIAYLKEQGIDVPSF